MSWDTEARAWLATLTASAGTAGAPSAPPPGVLARLEGLAKDCPAAPWPEALVARPAPLAGAEWHLRCLELLLAASPARHAPRLVYHARWLGHFLWPDDPDFLPRISVVTPVYNRAGMAAEAVASALALDWPAVEVVVVDDGSSDALADALAPFAGRIRVWSQPNRGVAAARNRGVALARGELVTFLDSDNLVDEDAIRRWLAGLSAVPDAELCFAQPRLAVEAGVPPVVERPWPTGGPRCPTQDFLAATTRAHPFLNVGTLTARWRILDAGPFDETLRWGEDTRFWFQLALAGTKAIGLRGGLNTRRVLAGGLTASLAAARQQLSRVAWLNLLDVLRTPRAWRYVLIALQRTESFQRWAAMDASDDPSLASLREALIHEVGELERGGVRDGLSPRLLLALMRGFVGRMGERGLGDPSQGRLQAPLAAALDAAIPRCPPATGLDFAYWRDVETDRHGRELLRELLAHADESARLGSPWTSFGELARHHKLAPDRNAERRWKALARVEQVLGVAGTRRLLRIAGRPLWRLDPQLRSLRLLAAAGHRTRSAAWRLNAARRRATARVRSRDRR
jgi:hypothetical protein